jgi:hypothetical protein
MLEIEILEQFFAAWFNMVVDTDSAFSRRYFSV